MSDRNDQQVNLLWTGGFDSTYRLLELSRHDLTIQPYYIINKGRLSLKEELKAMDQIRDLLAKREDQKGTILPTIYTDKEDLYPLPQDIQDSFKSIRKEYKIGTQYLWLAAFARKHPGLELSWEGANHEDIILSQLLNSTDMEEIGEGILTCAHMKAENNRRDFLAIFGNYYFPKTIYPYDKTDFLKRFKEWDAMDIARLTWFCSQPIDGEPCGYCGPCRGVIDEGMGFRMPKSSRRRYKNRFWWLIRYKIRKTLGMKIH